MNSSLPVLPYDVQLIVASYLDFIDIYALASVDTTWNNVLVTPSLHLNGAELDISCDFRITFLMFKTISHMHPRLEGITVANFNGLYWIPAQDLRSFISALVNVQLVSLVGTKLTTTKADFRLYNSKPNMNVLCERSYAKNGVVDRKIYKYSKRQQFPINMGSGKIFGLIITKYTQNINNRSIYVITKSKECHSSFDFDIHQINWINTLLTVLNNDYYLGLMEDIVMFQQHKKLQFTYQSSTEFLLKLAHTKHPLLKHYTQNIGHIIIQEGLRPLVEIPALSSFEHLHRIEVHYYTQLNPNFLSQICRKCIKLKTLKIYNAVPMINLSHLKHAVNLTEFSYSSGFTLQIDKFFMDFNRNGMHRMQRLYLNFSTCVKFSVKPLKMFFDRNPELIFFVIRCNIPMTILKQIQEAVNVYKKMGDTISYFKLYNASAVNEIELTFQTPIIHLDII